MLPRNITTALLGIMLLLSSLSSGVAGGETGAFGATNSDIKCSRMIHGVATDTQTSPARGSIYCDEPSDMDCLRITAQCPLMPLCALTNTGPIPRIKPTIGFHAAPTSAEYQSPIADVLTPPPDSLS